jgi:hypothetical protein
LLGIAFVMHVCNCCSTYVLEKELIVVSGSAEEENDVVQSVQ